MTLSTLKRQHGEVMALAHAIMDKIKQQTLEQDADQIAQNINWISGKLKLHLTNEDNYLYPSLVNSMDPSLVQFGRKYSTEMKSIARVYEDFKQSYNTPTKIRQNKAAFEKAYPLVFSVLSRRIEKEETELYPLISSSLESASYI